MTTRQRKSSDAPVVTTPLPESGDDYAGADGPPPIAPGGDQEPAEGPHIGSTQMKQLHALAHRHGITTDKAMYGYLSALLGRDVTSRRSLTPTEAAHVIRDLEETPVGPSTEALRALRAEFPPEAVGKLPRSTCRDCSRSDRKRCDQHQWVNRCGVCGNNHSTATMHIDFVGHADVTDRLLSVDPEWTWRPFTAEEINGVPPALRDGLWIMLTVCGVTRPGFGDSENGKGPKEAIGDALRNAAMRFGVALNLWAKGDREWAHAEKTGAEDMHPDQAPPRQGQSDGPPQNVQEAEDEFTSMDTMDLLIALDRFAKQAGKTFADFTEKFRAHNGGMTVDDLDDLDPVVLRPYLRQVRDWMPKEGTST